MKVSSTQVEVLAARVLFLLFLVRASSLHAKSKGEDRLHQYSNGEVARVKQAGVGGRERGNVASRGEGWYKGGQATRAKSWSIKRVDSTREEEENRLRKQNSGFGAVRGDKAKGQTDSRS